MAKIAAIYQGELSDLNKIRISPLSRAYTFSDSIYEVIPYFSGKPLCFQKHMDRLFNCISLMSISVDLSLIVGEIKKLADSLKNKDGYVYFQISRGNDLERSHFYYDDIEAERFGYAMPCKYQSSPMDAMLCEDIRWGKCNIKSTSLLGNVLVMNEAKDKGCGEVVMHRNGILTEAGASNVFYLNRDGMVRTSALSENILPGITREILLEALSESSVEVQEGKCSIKDFDESPSIWLTSSTKGLLPLKSVLGTKYMLDQSNNKFKDIQNLFESAMKLPLLASE